MTRYLALLALLAACAPKSDRADSVDAAIPAVDTLKARDSAFSPPRNLPQLDTVKKKP